MLQRFDSLTSGSTGADGEVTSPLRYASLGGPGREPELQTIEVRRRGKAGLREKDRVSTDTGASAGLTARIVASTNLICLHGEVAGEVGSPSLPQRPDTTLEGELDCCPASDRRVSNPSLSPSYEQQAVRDELLLGVSERPSAPGLRLSVWLVVSAVATTGFVGLVFPPIATPSPGVGHRTVLGGFELAILQIDRTSVCLIWYKCDVSGDRGTCERREAKRLKDCRRTGLLKYVTDWWND